MRPPCPLFAGRLRAVDNRILGAIEVASRPGQGSIEGGSRGGRGWWRARSCSRMRENWGVSPLRQPSPARSAAARATTSRATGTARRARTPAIDAACAEAVDLAREAAEETARPFPVGEHLGLHSEGDRVVT